MIDVNLITDAAQTLILAALLYITARQRRHIEELSRRISEFAINGHMVILPEDRPFSAPWDRNTEELD